MRSKRTKPLFDADSGRNSLLFREIFLKSHPPVRRFTFQAQRACATSNRELRFRCKDMIERSVMVTSSFNFSFSRFFFGCAILAAAVVFGLNGVGTAVGSSLFNTGALMLFLGCVIAPCIIACNSTCWNAGFSVFGGNCSNNTAAGYFWNCVSTYAIYGGVIAAVATAYTTLASTATASWSIVIASSLLPVFYGWTVAAVSNAISTCCYGMNVVTNNNTVGGNSASTGNNESVTADNNTSNTNVTYSS